MRCVLVLHVALFPAPPPLAGTAPERGAARGRPCHRPCPACMGNAPHVVPARRRVAALRRRGRGGSRGCQPTLSATTPCRRRRRSAAGAGWGYKRRRGGGHRRFFLPPPPVGPTSHGLRVCGRRAPRRLRVVCPASATVPRLPPPLATSTSRWWPPRASCA